MALFGTYIKHYRTEAGLTLRRVAELISIDPSYMSRLERDEIATPSEDVLDNLANALGRPVAEVYLAAGRITPGLLRRMEQGMPITIQQMGKTLTMAEEQLQGMLAEFGTTPISSLVSPQDEEVALKMAEAMMYVTEIAMAMSNGEISPEQFNHVSENIRQLKLALLSKRAQESETP